MRLFAVWNAERDLWEVDQIDLLSGLSDAFSETWPRSGMTRAGTAYALPTSEHPTDGSGSSSLLPTPMVGSTSAASHGQISGQFRQQMQDALPQHFSRHPHAATPTEPGRTGTEG